MAATGDLVTAVATTSDTQNTSGTTTSTGYTATLTGGTACGRAFVAPASGAVMIHNTASVTSQAVIYCFVDFQVRNGGTVGSGTVFRAPSDTTALRHADTNFIRATATTHVTGLTPGATYNVQQQFRTASGTLLCQDKHLVVTDCA